MTFLGDFFKSIRSQRVEAPQKISFRYEDSSSSPAKEDENVQIANANTIGSMTLVFIDSFRKMIDFNISRLKKGDSDYKEFKDDPNLPLLNYVDKIIKFTQIDWTVLPGAIVLLERMQKYHREAKISVNNMHRLLVIALLLSDKFLEDVPASNVCFAKGSGFNSVFFLFK